MKSWGNYSKAAENKAGKEVDDESKVAGNQQSPSKKASSFKLVLAALSKSTANDNDAELKKKIAAEVEEERQQKAELEALAEAEKYKAEMNKQEETGRKEALKVGKRIDPQVKQLDALVLQLQQEEENCSTKYLDWRNDLFEAVKSCESACKLREEVYVRDPDSFNDFLSRMQEKQRVCRYSQEEIEQNEGKMTAKWKAEEETFAILAREQKVKIAAADAANHEQQRLQEDLVALASPATSLNVDSAEARSNSKSNASTCWKSAQIRTPDQSEAEASTAEEEAEAEAEVAATPKEDAEAAALAQAHVLVEETLESALSAVCTPHAQVHSDWKHEHEHKSIKYDPQTYHGFNQASLNRVCGATNAPTPIQDLAMKDATAIQAPSLLSTTSVTGSPAQSASKINRRLCRKIREKHNGRDLDAMSTGKRIGATSRTEHCCVREDRTSKKLEQPVKKDEKSKKKGKKDCDSSSRHSGKSNTSQETGQTFVAQSRQLSSDRRSEPWQIQQTERVRVNKAELAAASYSASVESTPQANGVYLPTQSEPVRNKEVNRGIRLNLEKMSKCSSEQNLRRDLMRCPNDMLVPRRQEQEAKRSQHIWNSRGLESADCAYSSSATSRQSFAFKAAVEPAYTGPSSPQVDRHKLYMLARSGDGDPRSIYYYSYDNFIHQDDQISTSCTPMLGLTSPDKVSYDGEDEDNSLRSPGQTSMAAGGLQSKGLQSSIHACRPWAGTEVHAMCQIYKDLDEANTIIERFCNRHMLPPSIEAAAELRMKKASSRMDYLRTERSNANFPIMSGQGAEGVPSIKAGLCSRDATRESTSVCAKEK